MPPHFINSGMRVLTTFFPMTASWMSWLNVLETGFEIENDLNSWEKWEDRKRMKFNS